MADIQMEYRKYKCSFGCSEICTQCLSEFASDVDCHFFDGGRTVKREDGRICIPYGNCIHAYMEKSYKGIQVKNYEIEHIENYEMGDYMSVKIRGKYFECNKVVLDGVQIFPEQEVQNAD